MYVSQPAENQPNQQRLDEYLRWASQCIWREIRNMNLWWMDVTGILALLKDGWISKLELPQSDGFWVNSKVLVFAFVFVVQFMSDLFLKPYPVCCYKWMIFHIIHTLFLKIVGKVLVYLQGRWKDLGPMWGISVSLWCLVTSSKSAASWKGHMYPYVTCRKHILYGKFTRYGILIKSGDGNPSAMEIVEVSPVFSQTLGFSIAMWNYQRVYPTIRGF